MSRPASSNGSFAYDGESDHFCTQRGISPVIARLVGFAARRSGFSVLSRKHFWAIRHAVDVVLEGEPPFKRLWIEFEVSRADPVANHAKFATAHLFQPQSPIDYFLAMVSPHVTRGRRNLACTTIAVMRQIGMRAFQTVLLPGTRSGGSQAIKSPRPYKFDHSMLSVEVEVERAITITETLFSMSNIDVHFAGDLLIVYLNLRRWNAELVTAAGKQTWGRRTVTSFVYEPESGLFAPSKFFHTPLFLSRDRLIQAPVHSG